MSTIYVCDKCQAHNSQPTDVVRIDIPHIKDELESDDTFRKDICKQCLRKLHEWMNTKN